MINYAEFKGFTDPEADQSVLLSKYNKPLTAGLFIDRKNGWDTTNAQVKGDDYEEPQYLYTLEEREVEGLPSAYQVYMHSSDEYEAAMKLVGSLYHWAALCDKSWFMERVLEWRKHMALRDFSTAKKVVMKDAGNGDGAAARKLMDLAARTVAPKIAKPARAPKNDPEEPDEDVSMRELLAQHSGKK